MVEWQTRVSLIGIVLICALITIAALADMMFGLGWGYEWETVFIGLGIMIFGGCLYLICKGIFSVFR